MSIAMQRMARLRGTERACMGVRVICAAVATPANETWLTAGGVPGGLVPFTY